MANGAYREIELLNASINGDSTAFEAIVKEHQSFICAITFSATGSVEKSEELAHEAFVNAWQGLAKLKNLSKFQSWLHSITINVIRSWLRSQERDIIAKAASIDQITDVGTRDSEPVQAAIKKEQQAVVREALSQIPAKYREPLVLYYRQEQSIKQVAQQLELSEGAARTRLSRGRKYLKEHVAAMVETTISRTGPGKAFTTAVIGSIAALSLKSSGISVDDMAATVSSSGKTTGVTTVTSGVMAKIIGAAAVVGIGIALVVTYIQRNDSIGESSLPETIDSSQNYRASQVEDSNAVAGVFTGQPSSQNVSMPDVNQAGSDIASVPIQTEPAQVIAEEYEFRPKGLVSGLITDLETGSPVTDARVGLSVKPMRKSFLTTTDANGFYSFDNIEEPGSSEFYISSVENVGFYTNSGILPVVNLKRGEQVVQHFQLPRACQIDLFVVDVNGVGIKGARAIATPLAQPTGLTASYSGISNLTDKNGYIRIGGIKPSDMDYLVTVKHQYITEQQRPDGRTYRTRKNDYAPVGKVIKLTDPGVIEQVDVVMEKGVEVTGFATYADGVAASDVEIYAEPSWQHTELLGDAFEVDESGSFTLRNIVSRKYDIGTCTRDTGRRVCLMRQTTLPLPDNELLIINIPEKSPSSLSSIEGSIIYLGEKKPSYVSIGVMSSTGKYISHRVGRNREGPENHFIINRLEPGEYSLIFNGDNVYKELNNVKAPGDWLEVELMYLAPPRIEVWVTDSKTGNPVKSYKARAKKIESSTKIQKAQLNRWLDFNDEYGKSDIEVVGPGIYQIQVAAEGYAPKWSESIDIDTFFSTIIELEPGGVIHGKVIDEQGNALTGAKVIPLSKANGNQPRTEDVFVSEQGACESINGEFILKDLPAGSETLKVTHPMYAFTIIRDIQVVEGNTTEGIEIVLSKGATVEGYVYDANGEPEAGVVLNLENSIIFSSMDARRAGRFGVAVTDSNGFYSISGLPEMKCYVTPKNSAKSLGVVRRCELLQNNIVTRLDFGGTQLLTGTVVIDGLPLAQKRILLTDVTTPYHGTFCCYAQTDAQGQFVFRGVIPGIHAIYYEIDGKRSNWGKIMEVDFGEEDLDIGVISN